MPAAGGESPLWTPALPSTEEATLVMSVNTATALRSSLVKVTRLPRARPQDSPVGSLDARRVT